MQLTGPAFQRRGVTEGFFGPQWAMALSCACGE
jgi:hypothetical protein